MALISSKNLVAPLTNKIHITTIILVAMVFTVFRFAGGGVDVRSQVSKRLSEDKQKLMAIPTTTKTEQKKSESLFDVIDQKTEPAQKRNEDRVVPPWERNKPIEQKNEEATSLDDIRRMLGNR
jgi:hypothetical protein